MGQLRDATCSHIGRSGYRLRLGYDRGSKEIIRFCVTPDGHLGDKAAEHIIGNACDLRSKLATECGHCPKSPNQIARPLRCVLDRPDSGDCGHPRQAKP